MGKKKNEIKISCKKNKIPEFNIVSDPTIRVADIRPIDFSLFYIPWMEEVENIIKDQNSIEDFEDAAILNKVINTMIGDNDD